MFSSFSLPFSWGKGNQRAADRLIDISPPVCHDIENSSTKEGRALKNLIKANHANYAIVDVRDGRQNPMAQILGSAYFLGADSERMNSTFEKVGATLTAWSPSPGEISKDDWRDYLGKAEYQRAWLDFFEDQLVANGYDWKALLEQFLYDEQTPLFEVLGRGLARPLIQLGYAYELNSQVLATEALAMAASSYDGPHAGLQGLLSSKPSPSGLRSSEEVLTMIHLDERLSVASKGSKAGLQPHQVLQAHRNAVLEYCSAWDLSKDPKAAFAGAVRAVALATVASDSEEKVHGEYLQQAIACSHVVRNLLAIVPADRQIALLQQWWLFSLLSYIAQGRRKIDPACMRATDVTSQTWKSLNDVAANGQRSQDPDYVMAIRALGSAAETWADEDGFFLRAAARLAAQSTG